jgi:hypothetical protein
MLERVSATAKLYVVTLNPDRVLPPVWCDAQTRPTLEELSAREALDLPVVDEDMLFSTDDPPEIGPDLEGLALLEDRMILLVNDNDFGVEGATTRFWRLEFATLIEGTAPH